MGVIRFAKASSLYYVISINLFILPSDLQRAWVERGREGKSYVYVSLRQKHFAFFFFIPICVFTTSFSWLMAHEIDPDRKCVIY